MVLQNSEAISDNLCANTIGKADMETYICNLRVPYIV